MLDRFSSRPRRASRAPRLRTWLAAAVLLPLLPLATLALVQALDAGESAAAWTPLQLALAVASACAILGLLLARQVERRVTGPLQWLTQGRAPAQAAPTVREIQALSELLDQVAERDAAARQRVEIRAAQWEALVEHCPVPLSWTYDRQARRSWHNRAMQALLGEDPTAGTLQLLRNGRELPIEQWPLQQAAATGEPVPGWTLQLLRPGHPRREVLAQALPLGSAAEPRGAVLALVDLSAHRQSQARRSAADERLREMHRMVQQAQESAGAGVFHHDFSQDRLQWTPALCRLFGIGARQPVGPLSTWFGHIDEADRARVEREFWTACALQRPRLVLDYSVRLGEGRLRRLSSRLAIGYDGEGRALEMSGITLDLDGFDEAARGAGAAQRAAGGDADFRQALDHALRTPLGALASAADVLALAEPGSATAQEARDVIARQTAALCRLATQWLGPAVQPVEAGLAAEGVLPVQGEAQAASGRRVLLVHGDADARAALKAELEQDGHRVWTAADASEGLRRLLQLQPDVSMVEVDLPGLEGLAVARQARAAGYAGRLVALCPDPAADEAGTALAAGFDTCLALPADGTRLRACMDGGALA